MSFIALTLLFVGIGQDWWGWMAKIQFLPAVMRVVGGATLGNIALVAGILIMTWLLGRIYCSVVCPLGIFQDSVLWLRRKFKRKVFSFAPEKKLLRRLVLVLCVIDCFLTAQILLAYIAPYSAYGRMVSGIVYAVSGQSNGFVVIVAGAVTFVTLFFCAWLWGREWCNSICPVGTVLGAVSRRSLFRIQINESACVRCGKCYRNCKASCIDGEAHTVDMSRCVDCFECIDNCREGAISFTPAVKKNAGADAGANTGVGSGTDTGRRKFLVTAAVLTGSAAVAKAKNALAPITPKKAPAKTTPLVPFGSRSVDEFYTKCTACQLCIDACPNGVLRPSTDIRHLMQPEMNFDKGYCRPECTACSDVCPSGAILPVKKEEKLGLKIGTAAVNPELCVMKTDDVFCGNCVRHCPVGAVRLVRGEDGKRMPVVAEEQCTGCGACENLCPARPVSAILVDGISTHR